MIILRLLICVFKLIVALKYDSLCTGREVVAVFMVTLAC